MVLHIELVIEINVKCQYNNVTALHCIYEFFPNKIQHIMNDLHVLR